MKNIAQIEELNAIIESRGEVERHSGTAFGLEPISEISSHLTTALNAIVEEDAISSAIDILNNVKEEPPKVSSLWERYIPKVKTKAEIEASQFVIKDNLNSQPWKRFLNDPEIEKALIEDVGFKLLEDLSSISSFLDEEAKLVTDWAKLRPSAHAFAKRCVDELAAKIFTRQERDNPTNTDGIEAYKLTRMAAYRALDAHFTGNTEYEMSPELGGGQYISVKIKSEALTALSKTDPVAARQLSFVKIGKVRDVKYDLPDKRKYNKVFEAILKETDPKSFKSSSKSFSANHAVLTLSQRICPIMAKEPTYFRQKNFNPEVAYKLYSASKKLSFLSYSSLYPLLGTGSVPAQLPPNFVERFSKDWRQKKGLSLNEIAYAGFPPIIHFKLKEIVHDLFQSLPNMHNELLNRSTINKLKLARTNEIVVQPVKAAAVQRSVSLAFRDKYPEEFQEILAANEQKFINEKENDRALFTIKLRSSVFKECLHRIQTDPKKDVRDIEEVLLKNRKDKLVSFTLSDSITWAQPLRKKSPLKAIPEI